MLLTDKSSAIATSELLKQRDSLLTKNALTRIQGTVLTAKRKMRSNQKLEDVNPEKQR